MDIRAQAVRSFRLRAHHLDKMLPSGQIETAAGACGVQNSPPGAWETALFNRVEGCTLPELHDALYRRKTLLQAWSYRGVPVVFPTAESGIFLSPLAALKGEAPWIYTRGIALALEHLQMSFDRLLPLVKQAAGYLDAHTVQGKETLDRVLADAVREHLPPAEKRTLWDSPSMYGAPDRQTVGGAAVSFLLRPCSFPALWYLAAGGGSPTFASFRSWLGRAPQPPPDADRLLVRKFLHCHGPSTPGPPGRVARLLARTGAAALEQRGAGAGAGICGGQSALVPFCRPRCAGPSLRPAGAAAPARAARPLPRHPGPGRAAARQSASEAGVAHRRQPRRCRAGWPHLRRVDGPDRPGTGWSFPSQPGRRFRHGSKACWKYARRNTPRSAGFLF